MIAKTEPNQTVQPLPPDLAEVALIDAATFAAAGAMSVSWLLEQVRAGRAPAPVIRQTRCTRWRLADARAFWIQRAATGDAQVAASVTARATKASAAAKAKRTAAVTA